MIGTRYMDVTNPSRKEVLLTKTGNRRIAIRFCYPGDNMKDAVPCQPLTPGKSREFGKKDDFPPELQECSHISAEHQ